jgi:branched-chain amino acid transport system substrate-binding protein
MVRARVAAILAAIVVMGYAVLPAAGQATPTPGVTDAEITLGMFASMTGPLAPTGTAARDGLNVWAAEVNARGGIHGRRVRILAYDDAGSPAEAVAAVRRLVFQDQVFALVCGSGSAPTLAAMDLIRQTGVPFVSCISAHRNVLQPFARNVFRIYANEIAQGRGLIDHIAGTKAHKRIAILYNSTDFGVGGHEIMSAYLRQKYSLEFVSEHRYNVGDQDFSAQLLRIRQANPDAVILHAFAAEAGIIARQARELGLLMPLYGGGGVPTPLFPRAAGSVGVGVVAVWVFPVFPESEAPPVQLYKRRAQQHLFSGGFPVGRPSLYDMTGYIGGDVTGEGLRRAGRALTRDGFIRALESLNGYVPGDGLGFPITFTGRNHEGTDRVVMARLSGRLQWEILSE